MWGDRPGRHLPSAPRAFTLVELLVVIGIIGLLAAIITPVVMQSLTKARNAAIKAEIDMLHMAIMNYKNEYGSFPPCVSGAGAPTAASRHILRIFPRSSANIAAQVTTAVTPANAIVGWLSGYTDDPMNPVTNGKQNKLFDFDSSRISSGTYFPSGKPSSPYIYIKSGTGLTDGYGVIGSGTASYSFGPNTYRPEVQVTLSGTQFFNPESFQILCAGRDEQWPSEDDLSNFWPGTRREYEDSRKD
jgi:prepilin-type N-terminal cleavage/methylation domain-containing protein